MEKKGIEQQARLIVDDCLCEPLVAEKMNSLKKFDDTTFVHSLNVAFMATQIALIEDVSRKMVRNVAIGGLLHDIGKMDIPLGILNKPSMLTEDEYEIVKKHSQYGYDRIKDEPFSVEVKEIVLKHHERLDGSGYPNGLKEENIPWYVRYVSICDVYDAMTAQRTYKFSFMGTYALQEMKSYVGIEFDKVSLDRLCRCVDK